MAEDIKRMRYFDGLFLKQEEFNLEQDYNVRMRRLHNRQLHGNGIVDGLDITIGTAVSEVVVRSGMALDKVFDTSFSEETSREVILVQDQDVDLSIYAPNDEVYLWLRYSEEQADIVADRGGSEPIHWLETGTVETGLVKPPDLEENILLGKVVLKNDGTVDVNSIVLEEGGESLRLYSAIASPRVLTDVITLRDDAVAGGWAFLDGKLFPNGDVGFQANSTRTEFTGAVEVAGAFAGRVPLGGVIPVFNYGANLPATTNDVTDDGFMIADGGALPSDTVLYQMAVDNSLPTDRPNCSNDVFIMGATLSGQTGGANQVTVTIPAHSHLADETTSITVTGQASVNISATTSDVSASHVHSQQYHAFGAAGGFAGVAFVPGPDISNAVSNTGGFSNGHTHTLSGAVTISGLDVGGMIGPAAGQSGDVSMNADPHENRPNYISAVYLIRVN